MPFSSLTSMTKVLISVESAMARSFGRRAFEPAAYAFRYSPRMTAGALPGAGAFGAAGVVAEVSATLAAVESPAADCALPASPEQPATKSARSNAPQNLDFMCFRVREKKCTEFTVAMK